MIHTVFDTETTNLIHNSLQPLHKQPKIIEFFALSLDDEQGFKEVGTHHAFFNPGVPLLPEVVKITGLTDEKLSDKPKFSDAGADAIEKFIGASDVLVAHNISYDMDVCRFEFKRLGRRIKFPVRRVCTVEATESMKGFRLNLTALHMELFGEAFESAHSAEHDVRATARCYVELIKRGEI